MLTRLVSIGNEEGQVRLRRYENAKLTHDGAYSPESLTPANVGFYVAQGAPQDLRGRGRRAA